MFAADDNCYISSLVAQQIKSSCSAANTLRHGQLQVR